MAWMLPKTMSSVQVARKNQLASSTSAGPRGRVLLTSLCLAALTFLLFQHACDNGFINLDDPLYVTKNQHVQQGLNVATFGWSWTALDGGNWHPLTWLSLLLDARLFGADNPWGYHLTNVLLHTLNSILLFLVLCRMTRALVCSAVVATFFAVHPLHVESVAWISERKDVLSTFFWMLTLGAYALYVERQTAWRFAAVLLAFALGLLSKPMLVTLPFVMLLLDYWPLGRAPLGWRRLVREKIPLIAMSAVICGVTWFAQHEAKAMSSLRDVGLGDRAGNALIAYGAYITKMFWPMDLMILYPHPIGHFSVTWAAASGLLLAVVSFLVFRYRRRFPYLLVGWCWYLGTLVPVIGLVQVGMQSMADRYTYVPLIGLFVMIAWGGADLARHWRCREVAIGVAAVALLLGSLATWLQVLYWRDSFVLWTHALEIDDANAVAHLQLAGRLWEIGIAKADAGENPDKEYREAIEHYRRCVELDPLYAKGRYNLGVALFHRGLESEALVELETAVRLQLVYPDAWYSLGLAYARQHRFGDAENAFRRTTEQQADRDAAWDNLGRVLGRLGKWQDAVECFREAKSRSPQTLIYRLGLAWALQQAGDRGAAEGEFAAAAALDPKWTVAMSDVAWTMSTSADPDKRNGFLAVDLALPASVRCADSRRPRNLDILAAAYAADGDWDEAIATAEKARTSAAAAGQSELAKEIAGREQGYRAHRAYHADDAARR
jgi:tetratricopeptide (TPR) repeat protein